MPIGFTLNFRNCKIGVFDAHTHDKTATNAVVNISLDDDPSLFRLFSVGIHPWDVDTLWQEKIAALRQKIACMTAGDLHRLAAIGEVGLDKLRGGAMEIQQSCLIAQLRLAEELGKPVIIHCVKAVDEVLSALKSTKFSQSVVFHGFRGGPQQARQLLDKGFYLSFGPQFQPESLQEAWKAGRLLLETDDTGISIGEVYALAAKALHISPTDLSMPGIFTP